MTTPRRLVLRRESLAELSAEEAARVAAASGYSCVGVCMTGIEQCLTHQWCLSVACLSADVC